VLATIAAQNYWPQVRVLAASLARHDPGATVHVLVIDLDDDQEPPASEPNVFAHRLSELKVPLLPAFAGRYSVTELCTAIKPAFLSWLLDRGVSPLAYIDPDVMFFAPAGLVAERLQTCDLLLTPHFSTPDESGGPERDIQFMTGGAYNLGFLGLRDSPNTRRFLTWWSERTLRYSSEDARNGIFTDQRWIDLVPGMFDNVRIDRHPGLNVAPWNIAARPVTRTASGFEVHGQPVIFFHFSKFQPHPDPLRFLEGRDCTAGLRDLIAEYANALHEKSLSPSLLQARVPSPDLLPNGEKAPLVLRRVLRDLDGQADALCQGEAETSAAEIFRRLLASPSARARVRTAVYHQSLLRRAGAPEDLLARYRRSFWFRLRVDLWFYLHGPRALRVPVEWVEPGSLRRRLRRCLGSAARFAGRLLPRREP
jgi:hypothetical protein